VGARQQAQSPIWLTRRWPQCTTGKERRIKRWEHEAIIDAMQRRLDQAPDIMRIRRQTAEHPFGTIKTSMGSTHFLTRTLKRVSTEMSGLAPKIFPSLAPAGRNKLAVVGAISHTALGIWLVMSFIFGTVTS
jgi:hypothetical protein